MTRTRMTDRQRHQARIMLADALDTIIRAIGACVVFIALALIAIGVTP